MCSRSFTQLSCPAPSTTFSSDARPGSLAARATKRLLALASPRCSTGNVQSASEMEGAHATLMLPSLAQHCASPSSRESAPATVRRPASRNCVHNGAPLFALNESDGLLGSLTLSHFATILSLLILRRSSNARPSRAYALLIPPTLSFVCVRGAEK